MMSTPMPPARTEPSKFRKLRRIALFASIVGGLSVIIPLRNGLFMMGAARPLDFWLMALVLLATCIMPVFYFALYRNEGTLYFPNRLRLLALAAAIILTILLALGLPQWVPLFVSYLPVIRTMAWSTAVNDPRTVYHVSALLAQLSNLTLILLLITFYREEDDPAATHVAISSFLRITTRAAVIVWGLWLAFNVIRGLFAPYTYLQVRNYAAAVHRPAPQAIDVVGELLKAMLSAACWFCAPYIVYRSMAASASWADAAVPDQEPETHDVSTSPQELANNGSAND